MMKNNQLNKEGKRHGYCENYWSDGKLRSKGNFKNGKENGYWRYYTLKDSVLCSKGYQKNGERCGYWEGFHYNGMMTPYTYFYI